MIKKFAFIVVYFIISSVLSFASHNLLYQELKSTGVNNISTPPKDNGWHQDQKKNLISIYQTLQKFESEREKNSQQEKNTQRGKNVATFRIKILKEKEIIGIQDFNNTFFVSGGNTDSLKNFEKTMSSLNYKFKCIGDYCPLIPGKPSDFGLRENIVKFFDFKEKLNSIQKNDLKKVFAQSLRIPNLFNEIAFTESAIATIAEVYSSTLEMRFFEAESTESAKEHGLINEIAQDDKFEHIDELFGSHFQVNFGDSEQTIRFFINSKNKDNIRIDEFNKILSDLITDLHQNAELIKYIKDFDKQDKLSKQKSKNQSEKDQDKKPHKEEIQKYKEEAIRLNKIINPIILNSIKSIFIEIDIASYYDMCKNCQATFLHDIKEKKQIQKNIFYKVFEGVDTKDCPLKSYIKYTALSNTYDSPLMNISRVSLLISGLVRYHPILEGKTSCD